MMQLAFSQNTSVTVKDLEIIRIEEQEKKKKKKKPEKKKKQKKKKKN